MVVHEQPAVAILDEGKAHHADLIALENLWRGALSRLFLGSVADKVLRSQRACTGAPRDGDQRADVIGFLKVPGKRGLTPLNRMALKRCLPREDRTMPAIKTILHPTDFSEYNSQYAFRMACSLAKDYQARLILLHVVYPAPMSEWRAESLDAMETAFLLAAAF